MRVKRIVANVLADDPARANPFYFDFLGLRPVMDLGFVRTFAADEPVAPQLSVATEGGGGLPVPDLSIEVDDVDEAYGRAVALGLELQTALRDEPWGVRRFYVRDPFGRLVNVLAHRPPGNAADTSGRPR